MSAAPVRRSLALAGAVALVAPLVVVGWAGSASADTRYNLTSQADAMYYEADFAAAPASPNNQAGSLTAESAVDSTAGSSAFAGAPYAGKTAETGPGTANGVISSFTNAFQIPFTTLPGYVESRYPTAPKNSASGPQYSVAVASNPNDSSATATNGAPGTVPAPNQQQSAATSVSADPSTGNVISKATASVQGVTMGPVSAIDATTTITVTQAPGAAPVAQYSTHGTFSINGQGFTFDNNGFHVAGQNVPAGAALAAANTVLGQANTQIAAAPVTSESDPKSGGQIYTVGGLLFTTTNTVPGQGPATLKSTAARVRVETVSAQVGGSSGGGSFGGGPIGGSTSSTSTSSSTSSSTTSRTSTTSTSTRSNASSVTTGSAATGSLSAPVPAAAGAAPAAANLGASTPSPAVAPPTNTIPNTPTAVAAPQTLGFLRTDGTGGANNQLFYLVLVVGGALVLAAQQLISRFGVRLLLQRPV